MNRVLLWAALAIVASSALSLDSRLGAEEPPTNSAWAGFMAGSWEEREWIGVPPDPKGPSRTLSLLEGLGPNGNVQIQTYLWNEGGWVQADWAAGRSIGAIVTRETWRGTGEAPTLVADEEGVFHTLPESEWKREDLPDEVLAVDGRQVRCVVRRWTTRNAVGDDLTVQIWHADGVSVPGHTMAFGRNDLDYYASPDALQVEFRKRAARGEEIVEGGGVHCWKRTVEVGDASYDCLCWESWSPGRDGARQELRFLLHPEVPEHVLLTEKRDSATGQWAVLARVLSFGIQELDAAARGPCDVAGPWEEWPLGTSVGRIAHRAEAPLGPDVLETIRARPLELLRETRETLVGRDRFGHAILRVEYLQGKDAGIVVHRVDIPPRDLLVQGAEFLDSARMSEAVSGFEGGRSERYRMTDTWKRTWSMTLHRHSDVALPHRAVHSWGPSGVLPADVFSAKLEFEGGQLTRTFDSVYSDRVVGERTIECSTEVEVLQGAGPYRSTIEYRSALVPGYVVESDEVRVDRDRATRTVVQCVELSRGE